MVALENLPAKPLPELYIVLETNRGVSHLLRYINVRIWPAIYTDTLGS